MNPSSLSIVLRARSLLETCDLAVMFVRRGLRVYAALSAALLLGPGVGLYALHRSLQLGWLVTWALVLGWAVVFQGAFTILGGELLFARSVETRHVLSRFARRLFPYLFAMTLSRAGLVARSLLVVLIPSGFARSAMVPEVVLLEGLGGTAALRRAMRLGRALSKTLIELGLVMLFALPLAAVLAESLLTSAFEFVLQVRPDVGDLFEDGGSLYAILGVFGAVPLLATARLLAYVEGRARADGWDVQLRFQAIAARERRCE